MQHGVECLEEVTQGHTRTTVMTLVVCVVFHRIQISPDFRLALMGIATQWAPEIEQVWFLP